MWPSIAALYPLLYFAVSPIFRNRVDQPAQHQQNQQASRPSQRLHEVDNTEKTWKFADKVFLVILISKVLSGAGFTDAVGEYFEFTVTFFPLELIRTTTNWLENVVTLVWLLFWSIPYTAMSIFMLFLNILLYPLSTSFFWLFVALPISLFYVQATEVKEAETVPIAVWQRLLLDIERILKSDTMQNVKRVCARADSDQLWRDCRDSFLQEKERIRKWARQEVEKREKAEEELKKEKERAKNYKNGLDETKETLALVQSKLDDVLNVARQEVESREKAEDGLEKEKDRVKIYRKRLEETTETLELVQSKLDDALNEPPEKKALASLLTIAADMSPSEGEWKKEMQSTIRSLLQLLPEIREPSVMIETMVNELKLGDIQVKARERNTEGEEEKMASFLSFAVLQHIGKLRVTIDFKSKASCRFCNESLAHVSAAHEQDVHAVQNLCKNDECVASRELACHKLLPCGHYCGGIGKEEECLGCLSPGCSSKVPKEVVDVDDNCCICLNVIPSKPVIQLEGCKHVVHFECVRSHIRAKWRGPRIEFSHLNCPLCRVPLHHPSLMDEMKEDIELKAEIEMKAVTRLRYENKDEDDKVMVEGQQYFGKPAEYAMSLYQYYRCSKCFKPYFGGNYVCEEGGAEIDVDESALVCAKCSFPDTGRCHANPPHAEEWLEWKCRYCCSLATFFCHGNTHYCTPCHNRKNTEPCKGPVECPLQGKHPPLGEEFCLGCGQCRMLQ